jgi:predicted nucleic acid-binding protein
LQTFSGDFMATAELPIVVCDAGPLIHLDELECIDLLNNLGTILIPEIVWSEAIKHRPELVLADKTSVRIVKAAAMPTAPLQSLIASLGLDVGESAAIALLESVSGNMFLSDDAAARLSAESLGFSVHGTIGILVRSIRTGERTREQTLTLLRNLPEKSSLHISRQLLENVIFQIVRDFEIS